MFHDFRFPFFQQDRAVPIEYDNALSSNEYLNKLIKYVKDWTVQFKEDFLQFASERFLSNDATYAELNTENKRVIGAINEVEQLALQKETFVGNYGTTPFKLYYDAYKKYNFVAVHKGEYGAVTSDTYYVFNKYIKAPNAELESYMSFIELRAEAIDNDSWKLGATEVVVTGYEDGHGSTNYELREIDVTDGAILENQFYVWQGRDGNEFFQTYHNLIQNIYDTQMTYYKCVYDGTNIKYGDTVLTYNDIVEAYHDDNKFLFLEANGLTMIPCFPPVEGDPVIEFTSSWIEGGVTTISRVIVNSNNQIKFEDVPLERQRVELHYDGANIKQGNIVITNARLAEIYSKTKNITLLLDDTNYYLPLIDDGGAHGDYALFCALIDNSQHRLVYDNGEINYTEKHFSTTTEVAQMLTNKQDKTMYLTYDEEENKLKYNNVIISFNAIMEALNTCDVKVILYGSFVLNLSRKAGFSITWGAYIPSNFISSYPMNLHITINDENVVILTEFKGVDNPISYDIQTPTDEQVTHARANLKTFVLTQAEYDALTTKDANALYHIKES